MRTFGERLGDLRAARQLSQNALAKELDASYSTISRYENDPDHLPELPILLRMADYFGVSLDYLLGREDLDRHMATIETQYGNIFHDDYSLSTLLNSLNTLSETERNILLQFIEFLQHSSSSKKDESAK